MTEVSVDFWITTRQSAVTDRGAKKSRLSYFQGRAGNVRTAVSSCLRSDVAVALRKKIAHQLPVAFYNNRGGHDRAYHFLGVSSFIEKSEVRLDDGGITPEWHHPHVGLINRDENRACMYIYYLRRLCRSTARYLH